MPHPGSRELIHLYRRLLRSAATYPSKNQQGIYQAIQEEFRENKGLVPEEEGTIKKVAIAYKGLEQLRQFDVSIMTKGQANDPNWSVNLEQNPMPKPDDYKRR
mmetsp:Transcript_36240/g.51268  ORF Transcript_36240/g.51268 Transcript_36240/m.51268 type:complete len:103 (-) Transcript_36240:131-439(-)|eukprot:CAMPEP_0202447456 /NCGR_PEP_ID=MMETSP1360-20130828/6215_1 /ASSEMBLY_ACC=CAM_ASM_000848 /TAXON_ID=515479 /ORGANISM="Licmophora paradoxa, Strain CCMP2313" /LENGTH=102 /DNA_ID=CAMNT_0049064549 /DNA_START=98 /DNA_END=406 /DNA_ORIENTATION=-